jgi:hypothetical protein
MITEKGNAYIKRNKDFVMVNLGYYSISVLPLLP